MARPSVISHGSLEAPVSRADPPISRRVEEILGKMTLEEKIDYIGGVNGFFIRAIPRLGVPRLKMADGPFGVRNWGPATAMPAGIGLAATWNPALAERVGLEIGRDARARGVHFLLAPAVNIYRSPMNGRNFEYFGEDPFLAGRMAVGFIAGVQSQGVSATVKHFLGNNSEFDRHNTDSIIDERALREIYLPAFEAAVKDARVGALMTSYNLVDGLHMSQHGTLNTDLLRKEWGFDGLTMSDWGGVHDGIGATNGGQDLEMPSGAHMNRATLLPAIQAGTVSAATIDEKVRRILRVAARFGWLDREQEDAAIPLSNAAGRVAALAAARESMVLLKNEGHLLPLDRKTLKKVAVIGPMAYPAMPVGGGSARVEPFAAVSILEGLERVLGDGVTVYYHRGVPTLGELADRTSFTTEPGGTTPGVKYEGFTNRNLSGAPAVSRVEQRVNHAGALAPVPGPPEPTSRFTGSSSSARWSGYFTPAQAGKHLLYVQAYRGEGGYRVLVDDRVVLDDWDVVKVLVDQTSLVLTAGPHRIVVEQYRRRDSTSSGARLRLGIVHEDAVVDAAAKNLAAGADVVIAAAGFDADTESEGGDRTFALPIGQDALIRSLVEANRKTVVTITSGGGVDMTAWVDRVPAIVETWFGGQEAGTALAQLLAGDANFSGRLPATFERTWENNPNHDSYYAAKGTTKVVYTNGVFVGYRGFEHKNTPVLFPFGFGLSYTEFAYSNLAIVSKPGASGPAFEVTFDVKNAGGRAGVDVAQIYVAPVNPSVPRPPKELKGFAKVTLAPGESRHVRIDLDARAFSYWDVTSHRWRADAGDYTVLAGRSSAETPLSGKVTLTAPFSGHQ